MTEHVQQLSELDEALIEFARRIVDSNSDGVVHTVGAAVRDREGHMYGGINLYHFTGGPCAELVALATGRADGARELETIVAVGDGGRGVIGPCGRSPDPVRLPPQDQSPAAHVRVHSDRHHPEDRLGRHVGDVVSFTMMWSIIGLVGGAIGGTIEGTTLKRRLETR